MEKYVLVFDCGATNVRVIAMTPDGTIKASQSYPNRTVEDPFYPSGRIWPLDEIWEKLSKAAKIVTSQLDPSKIVGVSTTTFGVDGALVDAKGEMLYPVISWQCERTNPIMQAIDKYIPLDQLYATSGVYPYNFNTINKLIWLKENRPDVFQEDARFLFMPSLLVNKLTGARINDTTMLGTSMLMDAHSHQLSKEILDKIGVPIDTFLPYAQPGHVAGEITKIASACTGIPEGTPVCLSGHDTQFAVIGSGAGIGEPVLSSGTWEILMSRSTAYTATQNELQLGITTELDAEEGHYDIGLNYIGSGLLEWVRKNCYADTDKNNCYDVMVEEASQVPPGANGVAIVPDFYSTTGDKPHGEIMGLGLDSTRGEIYRASLEALAYTLRESLEALEVAGNFKATKIICVGGGSKNRLWTQIKADVCQIPVQLIQQKETTVLGSALVTFTGLGHFANLQEAKAHIDFQPEMVYPSENASEYEKHFLTFKTTINNGISTEEEQTNRQLA